MKTALAPSPHIQEGRIAQRFSDLKARGQSALITFITAGDPDLETSEKILLGLATAGADIIELSFPFSDPMADGPIIQEANQRALKAGMTLKKTLTLVRRFRQTDLTTPLVLMGYFNPIYVYGVEAFLTEAKEAGVDGLIVVDVPPEEDKEICEPAIRHGLNFIRLITPTTDEKRLPVVLKNASGFLYYVSIAGITGTKSADPRHLESTIKRLRQHTSLPLAVGFGINSPEEAQQIAKYADGAIIGSAIVNRIAQHCAASNKAKPGLVDDVLEYVKTLAQAVHNR